MVKLAPVSWTDLVKKLHTFGFDGPFQGGKHPYMIKSNLVLTIPNQHREPITTELLSRIIKQGGITREEWLAK
jgi:predicted RNA binding protein YcfA (HicA-like mRNA interferase family)